MIDDLEVPRWLLIMANIIGGLLAALIVAAWASLDKPSPCVEEAADLSSGARIYCGVGATLVIDGTIARCACPAEAAP